MQGTWIEVLLRDATGQTRTLMLQVPADAVATGGGTPVTRRTRCVAALLATLAAATPLHRLAAQSATPGAVILSPEPGERVPADQVLVAVTLPGPARGLGHRARRLARRDRRGASCRTACSPGARASRCRPARSAWWWRARGAEPRGVDLHRGPRAARGRGASPGSAAGAARARRPSRTARW